MRNREYKFIKKWFWQKTGIHSFIDNLMSKSLDILFNKLPRNITEFKGKHFEKELKSYIVAKGIITCSYYI